MPQCFKSFYAPFLVMLASLCGCGPGDVSEIIDPTVLPVSVLAVHSRGCYPEEFTYYGQVEPARSADLSFESPGLLNKVMVDEGDRVNSGDVIACLDTALLDAELKAATALLATEKALLDRLINGTRQEVLDAARSEVQRLEVEERKLAADLARAEKVYTGRSISKAELDRVTYSFQAAVHALSGARSRLKELMSGSREEDLEAQRGRVSAGEAELELLKLRLQKAVLPAPFDGVCTLRWVDEGTVLSAGQPVIHLDEIAQMDARFSLPPQMISLAESVDKVFVKGKPWSVASTRQVMQVNETTRTVDAIMALEGRSDCQLLPGETCRLQLVRDVPTECVELPLSALVAGVRGLWSCYRLVESDIPSEYTVVRHDVTIVHTSGESVYVQSALPDGALVVRDGNHKLVSGMTVRIAERPE